MNHPMTTTSTTRLSRPAHDRVFFGVCSGIAHRYGWDVVLVRAAFLLTAVLGGPGVLAYLILFFVMPQDNDR